MGVHVLEPHPQHLPAMARIRLAHVHPALALGGLWLRRLALGGVLDTARADAHAERRHGGLGGSRAGRIAARPTRCRAAGRVLVRDVDLSDTYLLQQHRDAAGELEPGVDTADCGRQGMHDRMLASVRIPIRTGTCS
jgi:hypothetical protein